MTEFSIFFHQNQLLKIRKFQDEVCNFLIQNGILCVPVAPIRIQCENLNEKSKITKITLETKNLGQENEILSLEAELEVDGSKTQGKIELVQILKDANSPMRLLRYARNDESETARNVEPETARNDEPETARNDESEIDFSELSEIKRINPFKICEIEITKTEKSAQWKILSEKWMKSK